MTQNKLSLFEFLWLLLLSIDESTLWGYVSAVCGETGGWIALFFATKNNFKLLYINITKKYIQYFFHEGMHDYFMFW